MVFWQTPQGVCKKRNFTLQGGPQVAECPRVRTVPRCFSLYYLDHSRQGCVLSPLLVNVFFAAILRIVLERFSKDAGILADLVHLHEQPSKVGPETALECVRRAIWGMLYADDACIVSQSTRGLGRMMAVFVEVFGAFGLTISESKTETMCTRAHRQRR